MKETEPSEESTTDCSYDPEPLKDIPLGMFHCPDCGEMVLAGFPHPRDRKELVSTLGNPSNRKR
jgi:predicted RNA-binding Zn-ribbon protein involved in translation (DUF1610 family)